MKKYKNFLSDDCFCLHFLSCELIEENADLHTHTQLMSVTLTIRADHGDPILSSLSEDRLGQDASQLMATSTEFSSQNEWSKSVTFDHLLKQVSLAVTVDFSIRDPSMFASGLS